MPSAKRKLQVWAQALLLACASGSAVALPVTFSGSFDSFTPGPGYGADAGGVETVPAGLPGAGNPLPGGEGGTLLDVLFTRTSTSPVTFTLAASGVSMSANIGTVQLRERFVDAAETDGLEVAANFTFTSPVVGPFSVSATGSAVVGIVPPLLGEAAGTVDLTIVWTPVHVAFGDGGLFELALAPLSFHTVTLPPTGDGTFTLDQSATITLLQEPGRVPEPAMLMLLGLGLAGLGLGRIRRRG